MRATLIIAALAVVSSALVVRASFLNPDSPIPEAGTFGGPRANLSSTELERFNRGRLLFDKDFGLQEGLGPDLNGDSCRACHLDPAIGGSGGLDVNVFRFANDNAGAGPFTNLAGGQIASKIRRADMAGREEVPAGADLFEQRQTPPLFGIGLIEGIADAEIISNEDPTDANQDGVFGVAHRHMIQGNEEVGKYGWKADIPTIDDFIRDAMGMEMGITTADNGRGFAISTDTDAYADPELSETDLADMQFFLANLGAPPRGGGASNPLVQQGELLFEQVGCATCHIPTLMGANGPVALYSNLLLHNVAPAGFRGMEAAGAASGFYRTPPLWGISHTGPYMHDGSAETLVDAIMAHEGEATASRQAFEALGGNERQALDLFLKDL